MKKKIPNDGKEDTRARKSLGKRGRRRRRIEEKKEDCGRRKRRMRRKIRRTWRRKGGRTSRLRIAHGQRYPMPYLE